MEILHRILWHACTRANRVTLLSSRRKPGERGTEMNQSALPTLHVWRQNLFHLSFNFIIGSIWSSQLIHFIKGEIGGEDWGSFHENCGRPAQKTLSRGMKLRGLHWWLSRNIDANGVQKHGIGRTGLQKRQRGLGFSGPVFFLIPTTLPIYIVTLYEHIFFFLYLDCMQIAAIFATYLISNYYIGFEQSTYLFTYFIEQKWDDGSDADVFL